MSDFWNIFLIIIWSRLICIINWKLDQLVFKWSNYLFSRLFVQAAICPSITGADIEWSAAILYRPFNFRTCNWIDQKTFGYYSSASHGRYLNGLVIRCLGFSVHYASPLYPVPAKMDHLKTGLVRYLDPHCTVIWKLYWLGIQTINVS